MKGFAPALAAVLVGCATVTGDWSNVDPGPKPDQTEAQQLAEAAIRSTLKDPDSGQFKNWSSLYKSYGGVLQNEPVWAICVDVNGKNSYGGYNGFKPWSVAFRGGKVSTAPAEVAPSEFGCQQVAADPARQ